MDPASPSSVHDRLVDYVLLVGPGRGVYFNPNKTSLHAPTSSWHNVHLSQPSILKKFPEEDHENFSLTSDVTYFCQPDGCSIELSEPRMHSFMLTDTESNLRTYGICLTFPHLFDPFLSSEKENSSCQLESDSVCIQEWGVLSVCILTRHPFFVFFQKALLSLQHFVEHFFGEDLTWNSLIYSPRSRGKEGGEKEGEGGGRMLLVPAAVAEVEKWIKQLLSLKAPQQGQSALEVELEVDPAVTIAYPPPNRLPLLELAVHRMFQRIGVCGMIEIYKLVLAEQKVILYSTDVAFVSECVLIILALLYPLQYLFPAIPLLPTSMPSAENLLMVPTPFFIGVHSSFLEKTGESAHAEAWMINLDAKKFQSPSQPDQQIIPEFPYSILQLQADIRKVLDYLEREGAMDLEDDEHSLLSFTSHTSTDDHSAHGLADHVDVLIRIAFIDFLFSPEILNSIDQYLCIYRLFTRPVVSIKSTAFLHGYQKSCTATDTEFIRNLISSQGIEYFFEWSLNPSNSAFNEVRRGIHTVDRLSDKQQHFIHRSGLTIHQVCLYNLNDESLLYQEMLAYKASHASYHLVSPNDLPSEEESDWELLAAMERSELDTSTPSGYSDHTHSPSLSPYPTHRVLITGTAEDDLLDNHLALAERGIQAPDEVEVKVQFHPLPSHQSQESQNLPRDIPSTTIHQEASLARTEPHLTEVSPQLLHGSRPPEHRPPTPHVFLERPQRDTQRPVSPQHIMMASETSSLDSSSLDGEDSGTEVDSHRRNFLAPEHPAQHRGRRRRKRGGHQHLSPHSHSISPSTQPSPVDSQSDDDTILVTRRRVYAQHQSFFSLTPSPAREVVEFTAQPPTSAAAVAPSTAVALGSSSPMPVAVPSRTVPLSAITHTQALEYQIQELVQKLLDGQGLPLIKPPALRRMASYEKTRVMVLRQLEMQLGVRRPSNLTLATDSQILPVGVTRSVYKGLLDLLRYFLQSVDEELQKEPEANIFSVFLLLRLSFSIFLLPKKKGKTTPGKSFSQKSAVDRSISFPQSVSMAISATSLSIGQTVAISNSPNRSPTPGRRSGIVTIMTEQRQRQFSTSSSPARLLQDEGNATSPETDRESTPQSDTKSELELQKSELEEKSSLSPKDGASGKGGREETQRLEGVKEEKKEGAGEGLRNPRVGEEGGKQEKEEEESGSSDNQPTPRVSVDMRNIPTFYSPRTVTPPDGGTQPAINPRPHSGSTSRPSSGRTHSPLMAMHRRLRSEVDLNNVGDVKCSKETAFLYKDLMRALGGGKAFLTQRQFWNVLFMSTVLVDRGYLGWNENTAELYERYNSLSEAHRQAFGVEEDFLLSLILHNLLVYMLMVGLSPGDTTEFIQRLTARTRLATVEEKLLQKTLKLVEQSTPSEMDLSDLGLMALYSEVHPTVTYIVHYGINMLAPVYKLQITYDCLILRRFPDEKISTRLWNDRITAITYNEKRATVTICYRGSTGECRHHFHSKEFLKVHESLQILVSVGTVLD